jgi:hypothetical protein
VDTLPTCSVWNQLANVLQKSNPAATVLTWKMKVSNNFQTKKEWLENSNKKFPCSPLYFFFTEGSSNKFLLAFFVLIFADLDACYNSRCVDGTCLGNGDQINKIPERRQPVFNMKKQNFAGEKVSKNEFGIFAYDLFRLFISYVGWFQICLKAEVLENLAVFLNV